MKKEEINELINIQYTIILDCQSKLTLTDYIASKISEGKATKEEYKEQIEKRQIWRDNINQAQEEIRKLEKIEPEEDEINYENMD